MTSTLSARVKCWLGKTLLAVVLAAVVPSVALPLEITVADARSKKKSSNKKNQKIVAPSQTEVQSRSGPTRRSKTALVPFDTAPFPYNGTPPGGGSKFLNVTEDGRKGHRTGSGRLYWEDETYSDNRVLLHIPKGFDIRRPALMIVFFHGHGATLERDVLMRQKVPQQISDSGINAVLVAPQFASDAVDSSAGKFWDPGAFGRFMGEAAQKLGQMHGGKKAVRAFTSMPVVIVAYSGGYLPAAWAVTRGGLKKRVRGVILLDALYGELDKFVRWIEADPTAFFVSIYLNSTRARNAEIQHTLVGQDVAVATAIDSRLARGGVAIIPGGEDARHRDLVTHAWVDFPIIDLLKRLPEYRR